MNETLIKTLEKIVGKEYVITERDQIENYLRDETPDLFEPKPADEVILVKPANAYEVSRILKICNKEKIPVFPRGGGTGAVGGAVPVENGIILSMERMTNIEIDKDNLMAIVEAGVTLRSLIENVEAAGLFFPLHPGDESAHIGGLVVMNAGGVRAVKYGIMRDYVKGMEVVLPTGEILKLGGKLHKNNVGYPFMHLIIGSEGTLGVITKVILKLYPKFKATATLIIPYINRHDAIKSVPKILQSGALPLAIEYVERDLMEKTARKIGETWRVKEGNCYLLVIVAESDEDRVLAESSRIAEICKKEGALEALYIDSKREQDRILKIRSEIYPMLKSEGVVEVLDVAVPPASMGKLVDEIEKISIKYDVHLPTYGHAGDGNLHVNIMEKKGKDINYYKTVRNEVFKATIALDGVITGEHGIGRIKIDGLYLCLSNDEIELMKKVKKLFDPNNILNPGCKVPLVMEEVK